MKIHTTVIMAVVFVMCGTLVAGEGETPFGFRKGMPLSEMNVKRDVGNNQYVVEVKQKVFGFDETAIVIVCPKRGLVKLTVPGTTTTTSRHGHEIRSTFNSLRERLEKIYGNARIINGLRPGSIWNEPEDFMMGIIKKERILSAFWSKSRGAKLVDLSSVSIEVATLSTSKAYVRLSYEFNTFEEYLEEFREAQSSAL